jgi:ADP-heptose:LPS heptosyltransferase
MVAPYTEIWAPAPNLPLFSHLGHTRSLASTGIDLLELPGVTPPQRLLESLRSFGQIVSWYGSSRDEFRTRVADLGLPFRFLQTLPPAEGDLHAVDFYLDQAGCPHGAMPSLPFRRKREGFAVIHPFSGSSAKNWPLDRFRRVAELLSHRLPVRWCAGPEEPLDGAKRLDNLGDLALWLAGASIYIGNDSGISHLAAAAGVPVIAMFGPTDPRVWGPRGAHVMVLPHEVDSQEVAAAALQLLAEADPAQDHP